MEPTKSRRAPTLTINGKRYDVHTGQPITAHAAKSAAPAASKVRHYGSFDITPAHTVHAGPARSKTLHRSGLAKPEPARPLAARHTRTIAFVPTHPSVSHFGAIDVSRPSGRHAVQPNKALSSINVAGATERPAGLAAQVQNYTPADKVSQPQPGTQKPAAKADTHRPHHAPTHAATQTGIFKPTNADRAYARLTSLWKKTAGKIRLTPPVIIGTVIVLLVGGSVAAYFTVPALSLFVAAKSAGVDATYPGYIPSGYHFKGPAGNSDGQVTVRFVSNTSNTDFTIEQNSTYWDSGAVLDNYVLARSPNYLTYSQGGLTVYTFGTQAAWVNSGVLHTIDGTAQLTSDQILRIAGSM